MQNIVQNIYHSTESLLKNPHFHNCHQIILILKGRVDFCVNGKITGAQAGDVAIFSCYENHSVQVRSAEYERYVLHLDPEMAHRKSPVYSLLTDRPRGFCNVIHVEQSVAEIAEIFRALMRERSAKTVLAEEMEQLLVKELLIRIYRCTPLQPDSMHDELVMDIKQRFENHFAEPYTLSDLAKQHRISVSALSHRFREMTGVSVMAYLQSCRMAHAKQMLAQTDSSIGEIVETCGFSDNSNFSRTFRQLNGLSPTDFRRKYKAE